MAAHELQPGDEPMPATPLLGQWRERRLYDRRPVDVRWVQSTWMLGGLPLAAGLNRWVLPALPLPTGVRRRLQLTTRIMLMALAALAFLTPLVSPTDGDVGDAVSAMVIVVAPILAGCGLHAVFGQAVRGAYRTLWSWGGRSRGGLVFVLVPMLVGIPVNLVVFWPLLVLGEAFGDLW